MVYIALSLLFALAFDLVLLKGQKLGFSGRWVLPLFFLSGFPALIYQIVWQRALFTAYGLNIEAVTVVVSAFMLGLGVGSLAGGFLSSRVPRHTLLLFGIAELGTAAYGLFSIRIFRAVEALTAGAPLRETALLAFLLVLIPTLLMGATLPLLASFITGAVRNAGEAVGALYFANTMGSALACFIAGALLMPKLGQSRSVLLAVLVNGAVGLGAALLCRRSAASVASLTDPGCLKGSSSAVSAGHLLLAVGIAAVCGFLALGYEILWYRVFSIASGGRAPTFAFLLSAYLLGIAIGASVVESNCRRGKLKAANGPRTLAALLVGAMLAALLVVPLTARLSVVTSFYFALPLVTIAAGLLGAILPLVVHMHVGADKTTGRDVGLIYAANIAGSVSGSLLVGFVLLDKLRLADISVLLTVLGLVIAGIALLAASGTRRLRLGMRFAVLAIAGLALGARSMLFTRLYEDLVFNDAHNLGAFRDVVENRSGVITVDQTDTIYGGGVYDGAFSVDLVHDRNMIVRAYALGAFHPAPQRVLMIGLSSGSWAQVIAANANVRELVVVEINPGYLQLIERRPLVRSLLANPKVKVLIDDGRKWLRAHPTETFDAIVMNTSFYWREHTTSLLSVEFIRSARAHLRPGGILLYNTTGSDSALQTGLSVFVHGARFLNFLIVSDSEIVPSSERWRAQLASYRIDGIPVFRPDNREDQARLQEVVAMIPAPAPAANSAIFEDESSLRRRLARVPVITDDNMLGEW